MGITEQDRYQYLNEMSLARDVILWLKVGKIIKDRGIQNMNYLDILQSTIESTYPKYLQQKVKKMLESRNIVSPDEDLFTTSGQSVAFQDEDTLVWQLKSVLESKPDDTIKCIEDLEYYNPYKYAVLFSLNNYNEDLVHKLVESDQILKFPEANDTCTDFSLDEPVKPTLRIINDSLICLKFSNKITGYLPVRENNVRVIKYTLLILIHKNLNTLEIRLDKIKGFFKNGDEFFYTKQINFVREWLVNNLNIDLDPINLPPVIEFIRPKLTGDGEVKVTAQAMDLATGAKAILDTGINDDFVLPLLGELKMLLADNTVLFDSNEKTKEIKVLIENFIFETEETASLPWISLTWTNEVKSKAIKVKFSFNPEYTLLYYYGNNAEMERMNNVTKYLIDNRTEYLSGQITPDQDRETE